MLLFTFFYDTTQKRDIVYNVLYQIIHHFSYPWREKIVIVCLPIDSLHLLVAYNKLKIDVISNRADYDDVSIMNTLQANQAVKSIFSEKEFLELDLIVLQKIFSIKPLPERGFLGKQLID